MKLTFLGGTQTVTGSKYLVEHGSSRILVDCGLYQGLKNLRERNWARPPVDPKSLDAVVLTHAHIDHSGYLPVLVKKGFRGKIWSTAGTADLCRILLPDAAWLQEEDARFYNSHGTSSHHPAEPLFDRDDVLQTLPLFKRAAWDQEIVIGDLTVRLTPAGHMLGAACVHVEAGGRTLVFSGDVGRPDDLLFHPPRPLPRADVLVVESTYGGRLHSGVDPAEQLAEVVNRVVDRKGVLMVPSFAVGRAQALLHLLATLTAEGRIPATPTYLDSPMAISATELFTEYVGEHRLTAEQCRTMNEGATFVRESEQSRALDFRPGPMILIAGSGMATGGRILHHLKVFAPYRQHGILLTGHQATGTRGHALQRGAEQLKIHGRYIAVQAERFQIDGLSGHADQRQLLEWLRPMDPPDQTYVTHGEPLASDTLRMKLKDELGWKARAPDLGECVEI